LSAVEKSGKLAKKRKAQQHAWLYSLVKDGLESQFLGRGDVQGLLPEIEQAVEHGRITPTEGARRLLALLERT
jgi:LAO/AO transport system kinase